jgi:hypothetical protein
MDFLVVTPEELRQSGPVRAAALHPEGVNVAERRRPRQQLGIAIGVRRNEPCLAEEATEAIDGDGDVFVFVGVDPDDDIGAFECNAGHDC